MGYREALKRGGTYKESEIKDVCVSVCTIQDKYDLAFIESETRDFLVLKVTRSDFTEGLVIVNKEYIVSISVVYEGDIVITSNSQLISDDPSYE